MRALAGWLSGRLLALLLLLTALLVVVLGALAVRQLAQLEEARESVARSYAVLAAGDAVRVATTDAETGQRGYLLTGDTAFLRPYRRGRTLAERSSAELVALVAGDPARGALADSIWRAVALRFDIMDSTVRLARTGRRGEAVAIVRGGRGDALSDTIRLLSTRLGVAERSIQRERAVGLRDRTARAWAVVGALVGVGVALVLLALAGAHRNRRREEAARRALQASEARFRSIHESAALGIVLVDRDGRIVDVNPAFERFIGATARELIGRPSAALSPAEDAPLTREAVRVLRAGEASHASVEKRFRRRDGTMRVALLSLSRFPLDADADGILGIVADVTEQRRAQELRDQLIGTVSHELRNPLAGILGALKVLERQGGLAAGRPAQMLDMARRNAERLLRIVNDLLDVERVHAGEAPMSLAPVPARRLVEHVADSMRHAADDAGIALATEWGEGAAGLVLRADEDRLHQVLVNLVGNALKFSPRGSTVTLRVEAHGDVARLSVHDEGRGIPADKLETVFERFRQVEATDASEKGGAGLGLPISRAIVQRHGGRIRVESEVGVGSVFYVELPTRNE